MQPELRPVPENPAERLSGLRLILVGDWPPPFGGVAVHLRSLRDAASKAGAELKVIDIGKGKNRGKRIRSATTPAKLALELGRALFSGSRAPSASSKASSKARGEVTGVGTESGSGFRPESSSESRSEFSSVSRSEFSSESGSESKTRSRGGSRAEFNTEIGSEPQARADARAENASSFSSGMASEISTEEELRRSPISSSRGPAKVPLRKSRRGGASPEPTLRLLSFPNLGPNSPSKPRPQRVIHLHTSGANPKSWLLCAGVGLFARGSRSKALVTFHSGHGPKYLRSPARALSARLALSSYEHVICVSQEISQALSRIGAGSGRHVVAPAFGNEGLEVGELPLTAQQLLASGQQLASAMLAPGEDYGQEELFYAMAQIQDAHPSLSLVVYGPGTELASCQNAARRAGLKRLVALGPIAREQALALMQASIVFVRPSRVDGDALSVREAMAMGSRVVASRAGHRPEGVILCDPASPSALAAALEEGLQLGRPIKGEAPNDDGIATLLALYEELRNLVD